MLLGERIRELRMKQGLSQEALAAHLGVSRQAVSKWEKNLSYPDTENLLALAALFGVSSDELAGIKQETQETAEKLPEAEPMKKPHWSPWRVAVLVVLLAFLFFVAIPMFLYTAFRYETVGPAISTETVEQNTVVSLARPTAEEVGEFALIWEGDIGFEYLAIGQDSMPEKTFPFGTNLRPTALEQVLDTDYAVMKLHQLTCGALDLAYLRISEEGADVRDSLSRVSTITGGYETPRGIGVGSEEAELLGWYGDELVYLMKESGSDILCVHDYRYAYSPADVGGTAVVFYISGGHVVGITVHAGDDRGSEAYQPDNLSIFPVKDGKPDFSERQEPEWEEIDATRAVFIALYALENDANLSAEEIYTHTRTIYQNLQDLDWQEYGIMGEAGQEDQTREELLRWLMGQEMLSVDSIKGLLLGACRSNLDGWMTDSYAIAMARAFANYPEEYVRLLAGEVFSDSERNIIISLTGYGSDGPEDFHKQVLEAMESLTNDPLRLSEVEWVWGEVLRARLIKGMS